ncbi:Methyltransferase domain-containing protein [Mycolicibacterium rutilum]|uniref:Methyltransferase domain-containing protein n=1 Tax=Mycolicibacterium rutilum TaxID=370526 RepID=A0A1H6ICR4_MYCRU|nr:methyltransferase [Mycolicibacterium rutilum]SEH46470.1 Methyltransferase domain-containing protein [Mycolicibacterium rutilum]
MTSADGWQAVWERKGSQVRAGSADLGQLLRANGYDTGHGNLTVDAWKSYVARVGEQLGACPGDSVYEVGCGAGAFLIPLQESGLIVAGSDYSSTLVEAASKALPAGTFECCEANEVSAEPQYDHVVASGVFMYFNSLDYAGDVIQIICAKSRRGVAIMDIPDIAVREQTIALRYQTAGSQEEYERRYKNLDHQYYQRDWFAQALKSAGAKSVLVCDQDIEGYGNAAGRFNVFASVS